MQYTTAKKIETNGERAKAAELKPAPPLHGYFFGWKDCVERLADNITRGREGKPPQFRQLFVETVNACNFRCPMCYTGAANEKGRTRNEFLEWKNVIRTAKDAGVEVVAVAGRGEPLLDQNFWKLGEFVRGEGLDFLVFTNGTLVTPDIAKRLKETCTTVVTKLFAMDPKIHDVMIGIKGEYVKTRKALVHLLEAGMKAPNLGIDLVITKQNDQDLDQILRMCRMLGAIPYFERFAPIGRGEKLNEKVVFTKEEANAVYERLRKIDEEEFGITWGLDENMAALAHAETDKRMVALHVDVFGNVQPGLETRHVIGNFRDREGGVAEILADTGKWLEYYDGIANEIGLEIEKELAVTFQQTYAKRLKNAAIYARKICEEHGCRGAQEKGEVPEAVKRLVGEIRKEVGGTGYEGAFEEIEGMVLDRRKYVRLAGEMLLTEVVYGTRHRDNCEEHDLQQYEWEAWGVDAHLGKDRFWKAFTRANGFGAIDGDYIVACGTVNNQLLGLFLEKKLEFAATNIVKMMLPNEREVPQDENKKMAEMFGRTLEKGGGMPIFWNLAYEHTGGRKDIPKNNAFFEVVKKKAGEEMAHIREEMKATNTMDWLRQNTACLFVGANDLAALAGFLYYETQDEQVKGAALEILRMMKNDGVLGGKIMRKKGIPKDQL